MDGLAPDSGNEIEKWLVGRGIPHFIDGYSASRDVLTRAIPFLTLVFLAEMILAVNLDWPWWGNSLSIVGGFAVLVGVWALLNRARGRLLLARPTAVGPVEIAVFLGVPALLPLVFGGAWHEAGAAFLLNLAVLGVTYAVTSYGLVPMAAWSLGRVARTLGETLGLMTRALPLLLLAFVFLFINAEVWQVAASLDGVFLGAVLGLFFVLGAVFVAARLPRELSGIAAFDNPAEVNSLISGTPAAGLSCRSASAPAPTAAQWANAALVVLVTQGMRVLVAAVLMGGFFVVFGLLTVRPDTIEVWTTVPPDVLATFGWLGRDVALTRELLDVAVFLAGFSGFYFTVYLVTDATYRQEFFEDVAGELREAFAVRVVYLERIG